MIGAWQEFGKGLPPMDGEALVFIESYGDIIDMLDKAGVSAVIAIHRYGTLFCQDGRTMPIPYGCVWTSLPPSASRV